MTRLNRIVCTGVLSAMSAYSTMAQEANKPIKIEVPATYTTTKGGDMRCFLNKAAIGKNKPVVQVFAQNNLRNIPMKLQYNKTELPVRMLALARNSQHHLAFRVGLNEVLYQAQGSSPYSWSWRGRAKAPASPLAGNEKPKTIKWWATVTLGTKTYISDTLTTTIE